jgi:hypothetical protein
MASKIDVSRRRIDRGVHLNVAHQMVGHQVDVGLTGACLGWLLFTQDKRTSLACTLVTLRLGLLFI